MFSQRGVGMERRASALEEGKGVGVRVEVFLWGGRAGDR